MKKTYDFTLTFSMSKYGSNPENCLNALYETGCDDAIVGTGRPGSIALNFSRSAKSAENAIRKAIFDVQNAIPDAELAELKPDLVGISDMAALLECSRQNIRKLAMNGNSNFPRPSVSGSVPLWHFYEVALWLLKNSRVKIKPKTEHVEIAKAAFQKNLEVQQDRYRILANRLIAAENIGFTDMTMVDIWEEARQDGQVLP